MRRDPGVSFGGPKIAYFYAGSATNSIINTDSPSVVFAGQNDTVNDNNSSSFNHTVMVADVGGGDTFNGSTAGTDTFVFAPNTGSNTISGVHSGDTLDLNNVHLQGMTGAQFFANDVTIDSSGNTVFHLSQDGVHTDTTITLLGVTLTASNLSISQDPNTLHTVVAVTGTIGVTL